MPSRTDTATSAPSTVVAMRSSSALAHPINPLGSHLNHFARTAGAGLPPSQAAQAARNTETAELITQPPANNDSSGDQSRRSSFGGSGGGLVMRGNSKQQRVASASSSALPTAAASTDNSESDAADRRRQHQQQPQQVGGRGDHNRNGSRNNNGRPGPPKPPLLRSKSDYARPVEDSTDTLHNSGELSRWGARHGFEDHYQSEDIISQLASVRICSLCSFLAFLPLQPFLYIRRHAVALSCESKRQNWLLLLPKSCRPCFPLFVAYCFALSHSHLVFFCGAE